MRGCATLMGASEVTSETMGWGGERPCDFDGGLLKSPLRLRGGEVRRCACSSRDAT